MSQPLKLILPVVMSVPTTLLTIWDIHNWHVILSMGMAWDTGPPVWPYQASDILLRLINFPATFIPFGLPAPRYHVVFFPLALLMWWGIGAALDSKGKKRTARPRWFVSTIAVLIASALVWAGTSELVDAIRWWRQYAEDISVSNVLRMVRFTIVPVWCAGLAGLLLRWAWSPSRQRIEPTLRG
jgi:hypothetical protein